MKFQFIHINTYHKPIHVNAHVHKVYELVYYIKAQGVSRYETGSAQFEDGHFIAYTNQFPTKMPFISATTALFSFRQAPSMTNSTLPPPV